jgi:hypothetical protein
MPDVETELTLPVAAVLEAPPPPPAGIEIAPMELELERVASRGQTFMMIAQELCRYPLARCGHCEEAPKFTCIAHDLWGGPARAVLARLIREGRLK